MRAAWRLHVHSFRRIRNLLAAMAGLLAAFQMLIILAGRSLENAGGFSQLGALLPPFARDMFGPALAGMFSFSGFAAIGYFHVAVMGALVSFTISLATMPAAEMESGFIDLILARPLARHWIISRSIVVCVLSDAAVLAMMMLGTWIGLTTLAPKGAEWPPQRLIFELVLNLGMLMLAWTGIALALAAGARRRSSAGSVAGFLALTTFLLDYIARLWSPAEKIVWLSPFHYFNPFDLLVGSSLPARNLVVLAAIGVAGSGIAYLVFLRRDITH